MTNDFAEENIVEIQISDTLDLHRFRPDQAKPLIREYLKECSQKKIFRGRIIHGKGIGTMREIVHSILKKHPNVSSFSTGTNNSGGWGSTSFTLCNPK